ncbi:hypothetical protein CKAH01_00756 [Colletotrichum kahawae]|uniref:Uncharacterized protein n=1 Tax=Colletotrichum kahawae TaxID=34407 RepID=A0AAE0D7F5_COLKA|nr:hypothetical protein CKAH01_00756 [Colletotrichum kahawae]
MEMTLSPIRGTHGSGSDPATHIGPIALGNELLANQWRDEREAVQDPGLLDTHVAICVIVNGSCRWRAPACEIREHSNRATRQPRNSTVPSYDMVTLRPGRRRRLSLPRLGRGLVVVRSTIVVFVNNVTNVSAGRDAPVDHVLETTSNGCRRRTSA